MHEASQEQLSFAAAFLDALPQAALLLDPDLRVVRVNRRLTTLLRLPEGLDLSPGTPRERIVGHLAGMLDRPEERDRLLEESETHGPVTRTTDYHLRDGRVLRRHRAPVGDGARPLGHLWLVEDVTRQHEAEEGLHGQVRKLAALADERAAFAGRTLHELRTPLATVLSFAERTRRPP
ncbi:PAS-domain containing protein [Streptomyces exfoliatus]|uniref:PAS-domain containing protein n=1 Tax=Streptomyces exfoliatus TaxID=1905 RepID=UPI000462F146|nr:PAS-domain containing protein [Streptomyces exfoliatus]